MNILDMTLNCIWCRGSSPEYLGNVEYPFIANYNQLRFELEG